MPDRFLATSQAGDIGIPSGLLWLLFPSVYDIMHLHMISWQGIDRFGLRIFLVTCFRVRTAPT